jgi:hypothetical protein
MKDRAIRKCTAVGDVSELFSRLINFLLRSSPPHTFITPHTSKVHNAELGSLAGGMSREHWGVRGEGTEVKQKRRKREKNVL